MLLDLFLWLTMLSILVILAFVVILKGFSQIDRRSRHIHRHHSIKPTKLNDDINNDI